MGVLPVRRAVTKSRSEPAISCPGSLPGKPSAATREDTGSLSPSQSTVPCSPLSRHDAFHDVSCPGLHQLPVNTKRCPPVISKMALAPASPRYQLHEGLYSSQKTETGSASSRKRAMSN